MSQIENYNRDRGYDHATAMAPIQSYPVEEEDIFKLAQQKVDHEEFEINEPQHHYDPPINVQHDLQPPSSHHEVKPLPPSSHLNEPKSRNSLGNAGQNIISS